MLTILVIIGAKSLQNLLSTVVGIGSNSQLLVAIN